MSARDRFPGESTRLAVTIARDCATVEEVQRLRHRVLAEERGARPASGHLGLDGDGFDAHCDHLVVREPLSGRVVGTCRILPPGSTGFTGGLCADREFDLTRLQPVRHRMVEVGRACIHPAYPTAAVMRPMGSALARYVIEGGYEYVIGVASIGLDDGGQLAASVFERVRANRLGPESLRVFPRIPFSLDGLDPVGQAGVPPLLKGCLGMGAWVCGEPALHGDLGRADLPMLLSLDRLGARFGRHLLKRAA
jgi:putative hemolysin